VTATAGVAVDEGTPVRPYWARGSRHVSLTTMTALLPLCPDSRSMTLVADTLSGLPATQPTVAHVVTAYGRSSIVLTAAPRHREQHHANPAVIHCRPESQE
jgi:hypothetical protein